MMRRLLIRIGAETIFLIHFAVVFIAVFGHLFPSLWLLYLSVLVGALVSKTVIGYCFLSRWEYDLRTRIDPSIRYEYAYSGYYFTWLTGKLVSTRFVSTVGSVFLTSAILINLFFLYVY